MDSVVWFALSLPHVISERSARTRLQEGGHTAAKEAVRVAHAEQLAIAALCEDTEVYRRHVLVASIYDGRSVLHEF